MAAAGASAALVNSAAAGAVAAASNAVTANGFGTAQMYLQRSGPVEPVLGLLVRQL